MDERTLVRSLSSLPLSQVRFFKRTGSTNDVALAWAADGAPDMALVYAEEQTSGRGRGDRTWFTPPGAGLAFSLALRPNPAEESSIALFTALGALAVCAALKKRGLVPAIKWPNDVLLGGRKVCGVLAESVWIGDKVDSLILGVGLDVKPAAVPPPEGLNFIATSLETELGKRVNRLVLLRDILHAILEWRVQLTGPEFIAAWDAALAFRGEEVEVRGEGEPLQGRLVGLNRDGSLVLRARDGRDLKVDFGEEHLHRVV